jgi:tetratricopeptide (TPR) repeat protein
VCQDLGKLDRAISCYRRAIRINADFAEAHNDLGTAYYAKGWFREAVECYREAVRLNPRNYSAYANMGEALLKLGDYAGARGCFKSALRARIAAFFGRLRAFAARR